MVKTSTSSTRYGLRKRFLTAVDGRAVPCSVPDAARHLVGPENFDYIDAFAVGVPSDDGSSAEAWARVMFTPSGLALHIFAAMWGAVTGLKSPRTGKRVAYFRMTSPDRRSAVLVGDGERCRIRLVVLKSEGRLTLVTFAKSRGTFWHQVMKAMLVGHRRVAPLLLERAVTLKTRDGNLGPARLLFSRERLGSDPVATPSWPRDE